VNRAFLYISIVAIFILFWIKTTYILDPDFGFHIRVGESILTQNVFHDTLSYTMSGFSYVNHEWLSEILLFKATQVAPIQLISFFVAGLAMLAILLSCGYIPKRRVFLWYIPFLFSTGAIFTFIGIRPQVMSWVFLAVEIFILQKGSSRWRYLLPLIFLCWINLHSGAIIGILAICMYQCVKWIRLRSIDQTELFIVCSSIGATLFNPYGINMWLEAGKFTVASSLQGGINEWQPTFMHPDIIIDSFFLLSAMSLWKSRAIFLTEELVLYSLFFIAAIISWRHIPLWVLIAAPYTYKALMYQSDILTQSNIKDVAPRLEKAMLLFFLICVGIVAVGVVSQSIVQRQLTESAFYPEKAITYLKRHPSKGELFAPYNWGGYLDWKYPEKKVFIDGRMDQWVIFQQYQNILTTPHVLSSAIHTYNIDTILWYSGKNSATTPIILSAKDHWSKIYEDQVSVIYRRTKIPAY
jgi:hypothetical protein